MNSKRIKNVRELREKREMCSDLYVGNEFKLK